MRPALIHCFSVEWAIPGRIAATRTESRVTTSVIVAKATLKRLFSLSWIKPI
jgi:hypothetical protein